jgi:hypothetical protein
LLFAVPHLSRSEKRNVPILHHPFHLLLKTMRAYRRHHSILRRYTRFHYSNASKAKRTTKIRTNTHERIAGRKEAISDRRALHSVENVDKERDLPKFYRTAKRTITKVSSTRHPWNAKQSARWNRNLSNSNGTIGQHADRGERSG